MKFLDGMNSTLTNRGLSIRHFSQKLARKPPFWSATPANRIRTMNPILVLTGTVLTPGSKIADHPGEPTVQIHDLPRLAPNVVLDGHPDA